MKKLLSLFLAVGLVIGVVGCGKAQPVEESPVSEESSKSAKFTYTFEFLDEEPEYNAVDCVDLGDYKKGEIVVSGYKPEYDNKDVDDILSVYLYSYSDIKKTEDTKLGKNDAVLCDVVYKSEYEKALEEDEETDIDYYTKYDVLMNIADLSEENVEIFRKAKKGDTVVINQNGSLWSCEIVCFGKFKPFTVKDITKEWLFENTEYSSIKELRQGIKDDMNFESKTATFSAVYDFLCETCEVEIPEDLLMYKLNNSLYDMDVRASASGKYKDINDYLKKVYKKTLAEYTEECRESIKESLWGRLILEAIVKSNKVKPDKSMYQDFLEYSYASVADEYDSVDSYEMSMEKEELDYNFRYVYTGLSWCRKELDIRYDYDKNS